MMGFILTVGHLTEPAAAGEANSLAREEVEAGWILLFDGESLFGWEAATEVDWHVSDGAIVATEGEMGLLYTLVEFGDYELKLDFRATAGTNSGVFLRTSENCDDPGPAGSCYELNIAPPDNAFPSGSLVRLRKVEGAGETEGWRTYHVTQVGNRAEIRLDNEVILDFTDPNPLLKGRIGLQFNQGRIEFRNIKLKPLGLEALFNGTDLEGWKVFPGKESLYSITPAGHLSVKNGPGQIESSRQFGDFFLQLRVKTNGEHLNSGVFFRCVPGEFWQGYESQIHNGFEAGDRTRPMDYGTGGIYRRQPARVVISNDFEWTYMAIAASSAHIATWVNGYPVSSWTDTRAEDPNPRNGLRLEPGTISIQGHDPTTDLLFADFEAAELPPRGRE
jgi:hypothetical protein